MLAVLALHLVLALVAPALVRAWSTRAFYLLAAVLAGIFVWTFAQWSGVRDGGLATTYPWVSHVQVDLALRMTTLSWVLALLISGVGAVVLVYCAHYFHHGDPGLGRFAGIFVGFAGSMYGVVVSDNLILLYVFWELTTVASYLLIGHDPVKKSSRRAAGQALIVTTFGGLAMLVGFIMLGQRSGTYVLSQIMADPPASGPYLIVALGLVLVGALSKSAILPFSFWLPSAMAAPTPVSAYLHAAAMVKAGVYLVAALAPFVAATPGWRPTVLVAGIVTMLVGGLTALGQDDLKLLLAYGTVSQLGLLTAVVGLGTHDAALAGLALLIAHALFKSALFLVVGVIEHQTGTRDLALLSGLWRRLPWAFAAACVAGASMAGLPPLLGYVAKEGVFEAFLSEHPAALAGVVVGSALTAAYTLRFLWGGFASKKGAQATATTRAAAVFVGGPVLLAGVGLLLGPLAGPVDAALSHYAAPAGHGDLHLLLWHGLTPALGLSVLALAAGALLFWTQLRQRGVVRLAELSLPDGRGSYERIMYATDRLAVEVTGATQRGSLPFYVGSILTLLAVAVGALVLRAPWPDSFTPWFSPAELVVGGVVVAAALQAVRSRRRLTAMVLVSLTGYGTAMFFVLRGAPDLALTQVLVETVSILIFVLALRRLPTHFSTRRWRRSLWVRRGVAAAAGLVVALLAVVAVGGRQDTPISEEFPAAALQGGGRNVVNVTLVDIRAWDTMGEISVLVVMATGVVSLILVRPRAQERPRRGQARRVGERPDTPGRRSWIVGARAIQPRQRSIILEVLTRLIFHVIILFSLFLLFSGHNAPGGGFAGGLVAGLALTVRYLAGGRHEVDEAAPVDAGLVLGAGLLTAIGTGLAAMLLGGQFLQSAIVDLHLPLVGDVHVVTSLFFDIGVYLVVIGLVLDILRGLGAHIDRQIRDAAVARRQADGQRERETVLVEVDQASAPTGEVTT